VRRTILLQRVLKWDLDPNLIWLDLPVDKLLVVLVTICHSHQEEQIIHLIQHLPQACLALLQTLAPFQALIKIQVFLLTPSNNPFLLTWEGSTKDIWVK